MIKDTDLFPITCLSCNHRFERVISSMLETDEALCPRCQRRHGFDQQTFGEVINDIYAALNRCQEGLELRNLATQLPPRPNC